VKHKCQDVIPDGVRSAGKSSGRHTQVEAGIIELAQNSVDWILVGSITGRVLDGRLEIDRIRIELLA
jgi:hypothetical protein